MDYRTCLVNALQEFETKLDVARKEDRFLDAAYFKGKRDAFKFALLTWDQREGE